MRLPAQKWRPKDEAPTGLGGNLYGNLDSHRGAYPKVANKHSLFWESASFAQILLGVQFRLGEPNWSDIIYVIRALVVLATPIPTPIPTRSIVSTSSASTTATSPAAAASPPPLMMTTTRLLHRNRIC